jgi:tetratricopeptide (TPR) repeat protein
MSSTQPVSGRARSVLALLVLAAVAGTPDAQTVERSRWLERVVPRMESAEAQLANARRLKRQMAEKQGEELVFWRKLAVEAYQAVRVFHPGERAAAVEGAFRAGELLRAAGDDTSALEEFRWAVEHGEESEFRVRARLESGHLHRRAERWRESLQAYLDAAADPHASAARREDAWLWVGSAWKALGRPEDARLAWRRVAEQGSDTLARVTAFDELALLYLEEAELEGAAGVLDECLRALSTHALEETEEGERVRRAMLRMRIVDELPRAIARRKDSSVSQGTSRKS